MLTIAIGALAFVAVTLAVFAVGWYLGGQPSVEQRRAAQRLRALGSEAPSAEEAEAGEQVNWLAAISARLGGWLAPRDASRTTALQSQLTLAGYRDPSAALYFAAFRLATVVALTAAAAGLSLTWGVGWKNALLWAVAGGAAGVVVPTLLLTSQVNKRQRILRNALPDALDIMVLSVEGGAGLNAALIWASEEIQPVHPLLGAELTTVQREIQLGLSAGEAFKAFAERCGLAEARDLAAALVQSEKYGAGIGKAIRTFADTARQDRQAWAEEVAQKASVKIIFPMLLCIFPSIFIVLLGPAAMQMSKLFAR